MVDYMYPKPSIAVSSSLGAPQLSSGTDKGNDAISQIRGFAFEPGDPMDIAQESTHPLQELGRLAASQSAFEKTPALLKLQMMKDLARTGDSVFTLSSDGATYLQPDVLRGVPAERIDESSPYWEKHWVSLETLLAAEEVAQQKKIKYRRHADALGISRGDRKNKWRQKEKVASDDCSKYAKIRQVFGNGHGKYHPNQLVAKHHLPPGGLCEKELLYKMACKISNLCDLFEMKKLAMDPYDFYRWVICRNVGWGREYMFKHLRAPLKKVIRSMGDDGGYRETNDEGFRTIVLYWASLTNNLKKFGKARSTIQHNSRTPTGNGVGGGAGRLAEKELKIRQKRQRRERKKQTALVQGVGYGGVNALRAMQRLAISKEE